MLGMVLLVGGVKLLVAQRLKELPGEYFNFYLLGAVLMIPAVGIVASLPGRSSEEKAGYQRIQYPLRH